MLATCARAELSFEQADAARLTRHGGLYCQAQGLQIQRWDFPPTWQIRRPSSATSVCPYGLGVGGVGWTLAAASTRVERTHTRVYPFCLTRCRLNLMKNLMKNLTDGSFLLPSRPCSVAGSGVRAWWMELLLRIRNAPTSNYDVTQM